MADAAPVTADGIVIHEYHRAAQPRDWLEELPARVLDSADCETKGSGVTSLDLSDHMGLGYAASSPCLLASFVCAAPGEPIETKAVATSQAFFVVKGSGSTSVVWPEGVTAFGASDGGKAPGLEARSVTWKAGDLFSLPAGASCVHTSAEAASLPAMPATPGAEPGPDSAVTEAAASGPTEGTAVLYWVHDGPLLAYLGVKPSVSRFAASLYPCERLVAEVERIRSEPGAEHRNRLGILLSTKADWAERTKTLTPTLWSLLNVIPAGVVQLPHKHNSVALDLAVRAPASGGVYTMMSAELDADGQLVDPVRMEWKSGAAFVTPPGWWHSHHNETGEDAWVLPLQDAGLHTHMQTLNIVFSSRK
jgi:gentisate 1,2-dioxygenase